jgi:hypothetical protein
VGAEVAQSFVFGRYGADTRHLLVTQFDTFINALDDDVMSQVVLAVLYYVMLEEYCNVMEQYLLALHQIL